METVKAQQEILRDWKKYTLRINIILRVVGNLYKSWHLSSQQKEELAKQHLCRYTVTRRIEIGPFWLPDPNGLTHKDQKLQRLLPGSYAKTVMVTSNAHALVLLGQKTEKPLMRRVLIIEDEEILRESILNILETNGFSTIDAGDGRSGVRLAKERIPDLILCDIRMPELDGYEVLKALRQDPLTASIPLLFITAENIQNVMAQGEVLGANGYLTKPFSTAQLLQAISKGLRDDSRN